MIRKFTLFLLAIGLVSLAGPGVHSEVPPPAQPRLGMRGELVRVADSVVPGHSELPNRGMRVLEVNRGSPAARIGLEPGDIIISVDSMRFTDMEGYFQALRCGGQRPSLIIVNVRTGQLVRRSVDLPHPMPPDEACGANPPHTYLVSIDLREDLEPRDR